MWGGVEIGGEVKRKDSRSSGVIYHQQPGMSAMPILLRQQQGIMRCKMKERETVVPLHYPSVE
jgi:hypothetical protein